MYGSLRGVENDQKRCFGTPWKSEGSNVARHKAHNRLGNFPNNIECKPLSLFNVQATLLHRFDFEMEAISQILMDSSNIYCSCERNYFITNRMLDSYRNCDENEEHNLTVNSFMIYWRIRMPR